MMNSANSILKNSIYLVAFPAINKAATKTKQKTLTRKQQQHHHPELEKLYFIDKLTNERIQPNGDPVPIDNDIFTGKMLIMVRTSDADEKREDMLENPAGVIGQTRRGTAMNDKVSNHFRLNRKRFEVQLQVKFKKVPDSRVFLSCGYDEPVQLKPLQRTFLNGALHFCKMRNPTFSYSLSGKEKVNEVDKSLGRFEDPHFAFPIETSLDRIAITKAGDKPPILGTDVFEDIEAIKSRQSGAEIDYNTEDTYTLCLWNQNIDFIQWKAMNLPAVPRFSLSHVNAAQPMTVKIYSLNTDSGKHLQSEMETLLDVEVSCVGVTSIGNGAKKWIKQQVDDEVLSSSSSPVDRRGAVKEIWETQDYDQTKSHDNSIMYGLLGFIFLS